MAVETFDPGAMGNAMDEAALRDLCAYAAGFEGETVVLSELEVARFAPLAAHQDWAQRVLRCSDDELLGLLRVFTLGEMQYASWAAGDKSPVVPIVKALKARGAYQPELTRWIKSHTTNKYLPHGSLMDRL